MISQLFCENSKLELASSGLNQPALGQHGLTTPVMAKHIVAYLAEPSTPGLQLGRKLLDRFSLLNRVSIPCCGRVKLVINLTLGFSKFDSHDQKLIPRPNIRVWGASRMPNIHFRVSEIRGAALEEGNVFVDSVDIPEHAAHLIGSTRLILPIRCFLAIAEHCSVKATCDNGYHHTIPCAPYMLRTGSH